MDVTRFTLMFDPDPWKIALVVLLLLYSAAAYRRTFPPLPARRRAVLATARALGWILLVVFLIEPALVSTSISRRPPVVPLLLDASRSMSVSDPPHGPRFERAVDAARSIAAALDAARAPLVPFPGRGVRALAPTDSIPAPVGEGTDIAAALEATLRRFGADNLAAIVLLSDGRITTGSEGPFPALPVPVFCVGFGDAGEGIDLAVERVEYPRTTYTGVRERIGAVIRYSVPDARSVSVQLIGGGAVIDEYTSAPLSGDGRLEAALTFAPQSEGVHRLEVHAVPLAEETSTWNNTEQFRVAVRAERLKVLFIDRHPDWNMAFLRSLAQASERLRLETVAWTPQRGYQRLPGGQAWAFPADLSEYGIVVIGDGIGLLGAEEAARLRRYVFGGGGLLLLASERSPLLDPEALGRLEGLLPFMPVGSVRITSGEFAVLPAPGSAGGAFYRLARQEVSFERLPPLAAVIDGLAAVAGAQVPFVTGGQGGERPFIALLQVGDGMSGVVTGFPLWRWQLAGPAGADAYRGLMAGLIQYIAGGHREPGLDIITDRTVYRTGERPRVTAFAEGRRPGGALRGEVVRAADEDALTLESFLLRPDPLRPGVFEARLEPLPPGEYSVSAALPGPDGASVEGQTGFDVEAVSVELLRTARDSETLERIAASSGGALLEPERIGLLPGLLRLEEDTVETSTVRTLRGSALLLAAIIAAFAAEWILRKVWGLV